MPDLPPLHSTLGTSSRAVSPREGKDTLNRDTARLNIYKTFADKDVIDLTGLDDKDEGEEGEEEPTEDDTRALADLLDPEGDKEDKVSGR